MRQQSILTVLISFLLTLQGGSSLYMETNKKCQNFYSFSNIVVRIKYYFTCILINGWDKYGSIVI